MTKKSKSNSAAKKKTAPKNTAALPRSIDPRKELLVRVAGSIAAQLVASPSPSIASASSMATVAVDIAEEILKKAGIPSSESSTEAAPAPTGDVGVGAAS